MGGEVIDEMQKKSHTGVDGFRKYLISFFLGVWRSSSVLSDPSTRNVSEEDS